ncbi:MAG: helix-hairpin-helix domain-containing protein [Odoribacter sp.]
MLFNTSERKGILIMLFLIFCIIVVPRQFLAKDHQLFLLQEFVEVKEDSLHLFPDSGKIQTFSNNIKFKRTKIIVQPIELNTADSATLVKIRGIGPYYAQKIIRYRNRLGGFHSVQQLKEVNMTYFNVDSSAQLFTVDTTEIIKRKMDTMTFKMILKHPYLEYEDVQLIFNAKRMYDTLSYSLLEEKKILAAYKLKKIKPYFK